jgi:hypothetical protein
VHLHRRGVLTFAPNQRTYLYTQLAAATPFFFFPSPCASSNTHSFLVIRDPVLAGLPYLFDLVLLPPLTGKRFSTNLFSPRSPHFFAKPQEREPASETRTSTSLPPPALATPFSFANSTRPVPNQVSPPGLGSVCLSAFQFLFQSLCAPFKPPCLARRSEYAGFFFSRAF